MNKKAKPFTIENQPPVFLHSISQLVTMRGDAHARHSAAMSDIGLIEDGAALISGGQIVSVAETRKLLRDPWIKQHRAELIELDCRGKVIIPGFVDAHTHPVFVSPRLVDFEKRTAGATYEEIAEAGGGIRSSITDVRKASEARLAELTLAAFREMAVQGTTTIEAKSGYGLDLASEIKSLKAIRRAATEFAGTVVATLLGAHVPPPEYRKNPDKYVDIVCKKMIPQVAQAKLAEFVDVFCERGAFTPQQCERILEAACKHSLATRAHVCQLSQAELSPLLEFEPVSLDHLDHVGDEDIAVLASLGVVATLVPGANYFLATGAYPPARKLIDAGVPVALATDYNPGSSPTPSMPFVLSLACTQMKMSPAEALTAATINGAHSLSLAARKGSIEAGKDADLAFFELDDYREIAYWFATNHCVATMMQGKFFE
jgi:imidazolonepropionase